MYSLANQTHIKSPYHPSLGNGRIIFSVGRNFGCRAETGLDDGGSASREENGCYHGGVGTDGGVVGRHDTGAVHGTNVLHLLYVCNIHN